MKKHEEKQRSEGEIRRYDAHTTSESRDSQISLKFFVLFVLFVLFVSFVVRLLD